MRKIIFFVAKLQIHCIGSVFILISFSLQQWHRTMSSKSFFIAVGFTVISLSLFSFISGSSLLRGSSSAQLAALRSPLSGGTTVRRSKGVLPCGVTFSLFLFIFPHFFHFHFFHSVFTFYDVAAQQSNGQKGFCGVSHIFCSSQIFGDFGQIIRVPQSWFLKCRIGCLTNCSGCTLASHLFPTNRGSKA